MADAGGALSETRSERKRQALGLFAGLSSRYDRMGAVMSFGQDPRWRRALVDTIAPRAVVGAAGAGRRAGTLPMRVLDVATGTGLVAFALAERGCEVVGLDQSEEMLSRAEARLARSPWLGGRVRFVRGEAERLPFADGEFDALSFTYLLRYVDDPAATIRELARVVRFGGGIGMLEFGVPSDPLLRSLWRLHTRVGLPLLGRLASAEWLEVGRFLGPNIESFYEREPDLPRLWRDAGIASVRVRRPSFGAGMIVSGVRNGDGAF